MPDELNWPPPDLDANDRWNDGGRDAGFDAGPDAGFDESADLHPWLLSATDLLVAWTPDDVGGGAPPELQRRGWDRYFEPRSAPREAVDDGANDIWDAEAAEIVIDTLYRFIHAIERGDIDAVMSCVAADYHAMEGDLELDRDALRLRIEASVELWRSETFRVTLTEIPEPLFHPMGVLVRVTVQIDFWSRPHLRNLTELQPRVLWFRSQPDGRWLLGSMTAVS
jgi:hypothetical protein